MHIENFHENQIKTSEIVTEFYAALAKGEEYRAETWAKTLDKHEEDNYAKERLKKEIERKYRDEKCKLCNGLCIVQVVRDQTKKNFGRLYVRCRDTYSQGHTFDWVSEADLKK